MQINVVGLKKNWKAIYLVTILFTIIFCFSLILFLDKNYKINSVKENNQKAVQNLEESVLNKDGYNDNKYTFISKFPLNGIVTSTIIAIGGYYSTPYPYSLFYYNEIKKGWYIYDVKTNQEILIITEPIKPASVVFNYDKAQVVYTVFENDKWLVKDLDIGEGKFIWRYFLSDGQADQNLSPDFLDLSYSAGIVFVKRINTQIADHLPDGTEPCGFGYDDKNLSEKDKTEIVSCQEIRNNERNEIDKNINFEENVLLALDINNGKLLWQFSSHNNSGATELFNFQLYYNKSMVLVYPISDLDYSEEKNLIPTINKIYILDLKTGKQLYSLKWPLDTYYGTGAGSLDFIRFINISDDNNLEIWNVNNDHNYFGWHLVSTKNGKELFGSSYALDNLNFGGMGWIGENKTFNTFFEISVSASHHISFRQINAAEAKKNLAIYNPYEDYGRGLVSSDYKFVGYLNEYNNKTTSYPSAQAYVNFKDGFMYIFKD